MKPERRTFPRFGIAQAIEVEFPKETIFDAEGLEISEAGIKIQTDRELEQHAKIFILIQTGDGPDDKFYFDGVVSRIISKGKKNQYGIGVTDISFDDREKMKVFISNRKGK
jgi:PilZ domain